MLPLVSTLFAASLFASPASGSNAGFETLQGFDTVVVTQINRFLGSDRMPLAMGFPVEPGVFVTLTQESVWVFDEERAKLQAGRPIDGNVIARECRSGCAASLFDPFRATWLELTDEAQAIRVDVPNRVMIAADAQLPAKTFVETAYAAAEARPAQPPRMYILLNGGKAGLRARPFFLVPPNGLARSAGARMLGLRVKIEAGLAYSVSAIDPGFNRKVTGSGPQALKAVLKDIKKRYPGKEAIIIDPGESATVGDMVAVMMTAREMFPKAVFAGPKRGTPTAPR